MRSSWFSLWVAALALGGCDDRSPGAADAGAQEPPAPDAAPRVGDAGVNGGDMLWSDEFEGTTGALQEHDPAWRQIFGQLDIAASDGAVRADPDPEDGRDDYGYRPQVASAVVITADVRWDPADAVGLLLVSGRGAVDEALYELGLYADRLQLFRYDGNGNPGIYAVLAETAPLGLDTGDYRLIMVAERVGDTWTLGGQVHDAADGYRVLGRLDGIEDARNGPAIGQGIGIYDNSSQASRVYRMQVEGR